MKSILNLTALFYIFLGALIGLGGFTFFYAKGYSYLSDDPNACANCHIMRDQLESWSKSAHHHVAKCNDCHLPHNMVGKYAVKALNGFNHSAAFTLQNFHEPIQAKEFTKNIIKNSCLSCHEPMVRAMDHPDLGNGKSNNGKDCLHCHRSVGHAR